MGGKKHSYMGSYFIRLVAYFHNINFLTFLAMSYNSSYKRAVKHIELHKNVFGANNMKRKKYVN